jgi:hypothetical protein
MSSAIKDGSGNGYLAEVQSDQRLKTSTVSSTENQEAVADGRAYNINTGWISSISADSALVYLLNEDDEDYFIDAIAVGLKESSATEVQGIYLVVQPTAGTLVSAATDCDMIENRMVGSGKSFGSDTKAYKATASGQTLTGGRDSALFAQTDGGRLFATVDFIVPKGQAIGIRIEVLGSFSDDVYAAIIGHKRKIL